MKGVPSTPGTRLPIPKELKGPVAITRYAALHLPTAEFLCFNDNPVYRLYGSPEKGERCLKTTGFYEDLKLSSGTVLSISGPPSKKALIINQFAFIKLFTFIKFPNGDKLLRIFIRVPVGYILKASSCLKQNDLDYFKQHPERVVYEN